MDHSRILSQGILIFPFAIAMGKYSRENTWHAIIEEKYKKPYTGTSLNDANQQLQEDCAQISRNFLLKSRAFKFGVESKRFLADYIVGVLRVIRVRNATRGDDTVLLLG